MPAADALLDGAAFRVQDPLRLQIHADGEPVWLRLSRAAPVEVGLGPTGDPDVTVTGTLHECLAALLGMDGSTGAHVTGDTKRLSELTTVPLAGVDNR